MIREITGYTVDCDGCGANADADSNYGGHVDPESAYESASFAGWWRAPVKGDYCPDCWHYCGDDEIEAHGSRAACATCQEEQS